MTRRLRIFTRRRIMLIAAIYFGLWLFTFLFGLPQVRSAALKHAEIDTSYHQMSLGTQRDITTIYPNYSCRVVAYAPFIVCVTLDVYTAGELAYGTTGLYFWCGFVKEIGGTLDWIT